LEKKGALAQNLWKEKDQKALTCGVFVVADPLVCLPLVCLIALNSLRRRTEFNPIFDGLYA
jgi:hypothetical protein